MSIQKLCTLYLLMMSVFATPNYLGMNIDHPQNYSTDRTFADAMRSIRNWQKINGQPTQVDSLGWPIEDAKCVVWAGIENMQGTYQLSFTGKADFTVDWNTSTITNKNYNATTNTTKATLALSNNPLQLTFTSTNGGVKNVKLMRPISIGATESYPDTAFLTNEFKAAIKPASVIRFMDWTATNSSNQKNWSDRTLPTMSQNRGDSTYGWEGRGLMHGVELD